MIAEETTEPHATTLRTQNDMRLDDASVAAKIQNYPPEIIEPVMWLAAFTREVCGGRRDVLIDRVAKLGFKKLPSDNFFYRVLTGRYFQEVNGRRAGSADNLAQIIDKLRAGVILSARAGRTPFVETSTYRDIRDLIDAKRAPEAVCKFGVIIGPTGGQKTESAKHYCHLNNHGACVHLEAPETPSIGQFLTDLAGCYGHSKWAAAAIKKRNIAASVNDRKLIIVDNVQRLYIPGRGGNQPIFNYLQKLQDDTRCAVILMFAADRADFLTRGLEQGYFEQFEGRAGGRDQFLILDEYTPREDLKEIAAAYKLPTTAATIDYLETLSRKAGRVRILFDSLQRAKREATARKCAMSVDLIREVRGEVLA